MTRSSLLPALGVTALAGLGCLTWAAAVEPHLFTVRRREHAVLPAGATPLRVLHLSDLHLTSWQHHKMNWVHALADLEPDLVVNTGDNLGGDVLGHVVETYGRLLDVPGVFVLGSNDLHAPVFKNPARYLRGPSEVEDDHAGTGPDLPTAEMVEAFERRAWHFLDNRDARITLGGTTLDFSGLGDHHMDAAHVAETHPSFPDDATVRIGVTHSPYTAVLDAFAEAGADLVFAGHTHGGQLRIPFWGAPVTNCDLPHDRARGTFDHRGTAVEVSAGLGFSPFAPVRFACRPEVTLVTLVPREE
ncbi:metallophosphoesterase [Brevibacterium litoralis]|uniref:metallophosphoesterase n=1 Tax=Brevibacterium litoralis TaxID=3138935 RepID=UPI0032EFB296